MYIISSKNMLLKAQRQGYAVPAFNIHNLEPCRSSLKRRLNYALP